MRNRKIYLAIFAFSLGLFTFFGKEYLENLQDLKQRLFFVSKKIEREKQLSKFNKDKLLKIRKEIEKDKINREKFFSSALSDSKVFLLMQNIVRGAATDAGIDVLDLKWGEVTKETFYKKFPVVVSVIGFPSNIDLFIKRVYDQRKILKVSEMTVGYSKEKLIVRLVFTGYKLENIYENKTSN